MKRRIVVLDSETNHFGRHEGHSAVTCAAEVAAVVLNRNPGAARRIGLIAVGAARMAQTDGLGNGLPQLLGELVGLPAVAGLEVHAFCASANAAVHQAALVIEAGQANAALVIGLEHVLQVHSTGPLRPEAAGPVTARGFSPPAFYAMCAARYLHETGAPLASLGQVAVNNRRHGASNPNARFQAPVTLDEVMSSRMIAKPLTQLQCCPQADGAGALLLIADDNIDVSKTPGAVWLAGLGSSSADGDRALLTSFPEDANSGRIAFERADIAPDEVDVAEVHDAFTIAQIIHLEDLGLSPKGLGWRHALERNPRLIVNPSGGLLSRGHPLGATGIAQFDGIRRYLVDDRIQLNRRRFGLVQEAGGLRSLGQVQSESAVLKRIGA